MDKPRTEIKMEDLVCLIDTREQHPFDLLPLRSDRYTLTTGDYTVLGLENEIVIERKSLADLVMCCGVERERFDKEVQRLLAFPSKLMIIEATWTQIESGGWRSKLQPSQVIGSVLGWQALGLPILTVNDHVTAGRYAARFLFIAARRRWRQLQSLSRGLRIVQVNEDDKIGA